MRCAAWVRAAELRFKRELWQQNKRETEMVGPGLLGGWKRCLGWDTLALGTPDVVLTVSSR